jgi:uncharacterized protein (TIGR04255 family)
VEVTEPAFHEPPVIEVALGVSYKPFMRFTLAHFGIFWQRIRSAYSKVDFKPPTLPLPQHLGDQEPFLPVRAWFMEESEVRLVQLQSDRLLLNWRKLSPGDSYPRFDNLKPEFERLWSLLASFKDEEALGPIEAPRCEVTYVNRVSLAPTEGGPPRLNVFFPLLAADRPSIVKGASFVAFAETVVVPPDQAQLNMTLNAVPGQGGNPGLQFQISASGDCTTATWRDVSARLDTLHRLAVTAFVEGTTEPLHRQWRQESGQ